MHLRISFSPETIPGLNSEELCSICNELSAVWYFQFAHVKKKKKDGFLSIFNDGEFFSFLIFLLKIWDTCQVAHFHDQNSCNFRSGWADSSALQQEKSSMASEGSPVSPGQIILSIKFALSGLTIYYFLGFSRTLWLRTKPEHKQWGYCCFPWQSIFCMNWLHQRFFSHYEVL